MDCYKIETIESKIFKTRKDLSNQVVNPYIQHPIAEGTKTPRD